MQAITDYCRMNTFAFLNFIISLTGRNKINFVQILLYVIVISYLLFYLYNDTISWENWVNILLFSYPLILIPFYQVTLWSPLMHLKQWLSQIFSTDQIWMGTHIYMLIFSSGVQTLFVLLLYFFGLWQGPIFGLIGYNLCIAISLNSVLQFSGSLLSVLHINSLSWNYMVCIPLSLPLFLNSKALLNSLEMSAESVNDGLGLSLLYMLFAVYILFSASSYLLYNKIWNS